MPWTMVDDTPGPMMRWQTRLTAADPDSGPQSLALIDQATVQVEGTFGGATVHLRGSNSGQRFVPFDAIRHDDVVGVLPVLWLEVEALDADDETDVLVTLAGRR